MKNASHRPVQHKFSEVPKAEIPRSTFDRSSGTKTTFNGGMLIPIFTDEVLPGDTFSMKANIVARLSTLLTPIMDNVYLDLFFFYVPIRLLWENWERFNGAQTNPGDSTDFLVPSMTAPASTGYEEQSLEDYFGIPTKEDGFSHTCLYHRAYAKIWDEWFRDQNLQDSNLVPVDDGPDLPNEYELLPRGKRHDYFTSCLPFSQKGPAVTIPLGSVAPVVTAGDGFPEFLIDSVPGFRLEGLSAGPAAQWDSTPTADSGAAWSATKLQADLTGATAATINTLREAFQIQRLYERDARGGTRYTEILKAHFGVTSPDHRLQRPEYLGGATIPIMINTAIANSEGTNQELGDLAGFGTAVKVGVGWHKSFTEHGIIIGMISARADLNYQQGLSRMFSRSTRFDYFMPVLAHLGEQAVLNKEIYMRGDANDDQAFGYQERYAEYRYKPNMITGLMRSNAANSLDIWHLAQDFATPPTLGDTFIQENAPFGRVVAVPSEPHFLLDAHFQLHCARPIPTYAVPGMIDHF